jgi:hypothetical protein
MCDRELPHLDFCDVVYLFVTVSRTDCRAWNFMVVNNEFEGLCNEVVVA